MVGIICLDKPEGITSSKALIAVRRALGVKKAGHTGTLDPMATGVLPIFVDRATRFIGALPCRAKAYRAEVKLGLTTDTLDITGQVLDQKSSAVRREELENLLASFVGTTFQTPPMYSAISVNGVRLYELARQGVEVERKKRRITVYSLTLDEFREREQTFTITVRCSEGTYIRTIADDIGRLLGCGACLRSLRRLYSSGFDLADCVTLEEVQALAAAGELEKHLMPVERAFSGYSAVTVAATQANRLRNGAPLALDRIGNPADGTYRVYERESGQFVGIAAVDRPDGSLKGKVILNLE